MCPWLVGDEWKNISKKGGRYIFGHFELPSFFMNAMVQMPDHGEIQLSDFQNYELGFSGHFHKRQQQKNMIYIGNAFPHNYSDNWDDERGMMILEWGKQPEYYTWTGQPTFRTTKLSELIDRADEIILPKAHLRVSLDIDISYEEASFIKEKFIFFHSIFSHCFDNILFSIRFTKIRTHKLIIFNFIINKLLISKPSST